MEKWRKEIEELLSRNRTVDRWLIQDLVQRQKDDPVHEATLAAMRHLMTAMRLLSTGPGAISQTEIKEKVRKSCVESGMPIEAINFFFTMLERQDPLGPKGRPEKPTGEETNESPGEDT